MKTVVLNITDEVYEAFCQHMAIRQVMDDLTPKDNPADKILVAVLYAVRKEMHAINIGKPQGKGK